MEACLSFSTWHFMTDGNTPSSSFSSLSFHIFPWMKEPLWPFLSQFHLNRKPDTPQCIQLFCNQFPFYSIFLQKVREHFTNCAGTIFTRQSRGLLLKTRIEKWIQNAKFHFDEWVISFECVIWVTQHLENPAWQVNRYWRNFKWARCCDPVRNPLSFF